MTTNIEWLSPLIEIDTTLEPDDFLRELFTYFLKVYKSEKTYFDIPVYFKIRGNLTYKNNEFLHFVTHDSYAFERSYSIDINRSLRLKWIADILMNHFDSYIMIFSKQINGEDRIHFLLPNERYMLVIAYEQDFDKYFIRTSFYIDNEQKLSGYIIDYKKFYNSLRKKEDS